MSEIFYRQGIPTERCLAVIGFPEGRATLLETAEGVSVDQVIAATEAELVVH